jgi:hypothetical protein
MGNWKTAYNWMMDNEDPQRSCTEVPSVCPGGVNGPCYSISGIKSCVWPAEFEAIAALPQGEREPLVQQFYENHFSNSWYAQLASDEVCKRVFDFAANCGSSTAVRCLQQALNSLTGPDGAQLVDDGDWSAMTLDAANAADPLALVAAFKVQRADYYRSLVAANPGMANYLGTWIARAEK